jgi:hypothetical protein
MAGAPPTALTLSTTTAPLKKPKAELTMAQRIERREQEGGGRRNAALKRRVEATTAKRQGARGR